MLDWIEQYVPPPQRKKWMKKYVTKSKQFVLFDFFIFTACGNGYRLSQTDFKVEVQDARDTQACSRACDNMHGCISYEFTTPGQTCTLNSNSQPALGEYKKRDLCVKEFFEDTIVVSGKLTISIEVLLDQNFALPELPIEH